MTELHQSRPHQARLPASGSFMERWRPVASRILVPVLAVGLFALAIWTIHHSIAAIRFTQIRREIVAIPGDGLLLDGGLPAASFPARAFQEFGALWATGKGVPFPRAVLAPCNAQPLPPSTGFAA